MSNLQQSTFLGDEVREKNSLISVPSEKLTCLLVPRFSAPKVAPRAR